MHGAGHGVAEVVRGGLRGGAAASGRPGLRDVGRVAGRRVGARRRLEDGEVCAQAAFWARRELTAVCSS